MFVTCSRILPDGEPNLSEMRVKSSSWSSGVYHMYEYVLLDSPQQTEIWTDLLKEISTKC